VQDNAANTVEKLYGIGVLFRNNTEELNADNSCRHFVFISLSKFVITPGIQLSLSRWYNTQNWNKECDAGT